MHNTTAVIVALALASGVVGAAIGRPKPRVRIGGGFLLGLVLGPIGWLVAARARPALVDPPLVVFAVEAIPGDGTAGWYPDPYGRYDARWWDGSSWTSQVAKVAFDGTRTVASDPTAFGLRRPADPPGPGHEAPRAS